MCGRVVSARPLAALVDHFAVDEVATPALAFRYNVPPTADVYAIIDAPGGVRRLGTMTWGLPAPGSHRTGAGARPFNARAETLTERRMFAEAFTRRRCLVPVDGFFEWRQGQPYLVAPADGSPLALAGIWDRPTEPDPVAGCAVVTTAATGELARLHDRMPAMLSPSAWDVWLAPSNYDTDALGELLRRAAGSGLSIRPVDRRVNDVANDGADLLAAPTHLAMPLPDLA